MNRSPDVLCFFQRVISDRCVEYGSSTLLMILCVNREAMPNQLALNSGIILGMRHANERRRQCNDVSHWLGAYPEWSLWTDRQPSGCLNSKLPLCQCRKSHCGDKTVIRLSYLHNGISFSGKMTSLYWIRALEAASIVSCHFTSAWKHVVKVRWSYDHLYLLWWNYIMVPEQVLGVSLLHSLSVRNIFMGFHVNGNVTWATISIKTVFPGVKILTNSIFIMGITIYY